MSARGTLVITGAGRGIGAATAHLAAASGYAVVVNYVRDQVAADGVVQAILAAGGTALAVQADIANDDAVMRLFERADALGPLRALVNNAGTTGPIARVDTVTTATLHDLFALNVIGSFACAREAVRRMSTTHGGSGGGIVNVSSAASRLGSPHEFVHYAASKGAIDTFTVGLAREVAAEGIRVNAVRPGLIQTDIHAAAGDAGRPARLASSIPMQRVGTADEVARTILWLLSDASAYVTGALLDVSGGR